MATALDSASTPRRFTLHGPIRIWDLTERRLSLGGRNLWVAPDVETGNLTLGTEIVAKGYEEEHGERWVVDLITITSTTPDTRRRPGMPGRARPRP